MKKTTVLVHRCPHCGAVHDRATGLPGVDTRPAEGDVSVCIRCAGVGRWRADGTLGAWPAGEPLPDDVKAAVKKLEHIIERTHWSARMVREHWN